MLSNILVVRREIKIKILREFKRKLFKRKGLLLFEKYFHFECGLKRQERKENSNDITHFSCAFAAEKVNLFSNQTVVFSKAMLDYEKFMKRFMGVFWEENGSNKWKEKLLWNEILSCFLFNKYRKTFA